MSIYSALVNANRIVTATATSTAVGTTQSKIALALGPWPTYSRLKKITLKASSGSVSATVSILKDGAAYRAGSNDPAYLTTSFSVNGSPTPWTSTTQDLASVYHVDMTGAGVLCLQISAASGNLDAGVTFTVTVEGEALQETDLAHADVTGVRADNTFRVLRATTAATTDLTKELLGNGNAYGASMGETYTCFAASSDVIYVGSAKQFSKIGVVVPSYAAQIAGKTTTISQWTGSSWTSVTKYDNTSDAQGTASSLSFSGAIKFDINAGWVKSQISTDPLKVYEDAVLAGDAPPLGMLVNPDRYWIKIAVGGTPSPADLKLASLKILS